jgi:hypothetical protein
MGKERSGGATRFGAKRADEIIHRFRGALVKRCNIRLSLTPATSLA